MPGFALHQGEGRSYDWRGHLFTIKAGAAETEGKLALWEFTTKKGDEPHDHIHDDMDEIFIILEGRLMVRCGDDAFDVHEGGFVYLPRGIQHGYTIHNDGPVRFLGISTPSDFGDHIEATGTRISDKEARKRYETLMAERGG